MMERWSLTAGHVPDAWATALVVLCALLAAAEGLRTYWRPKSPVPRRTATAILALRFLGIAALLGIAFELTLRVEQVAPAGRRLVVLVDRSASMALPDALEPGGATKTRQARAEALWAASQDARDAWAENGLVVDVRGFDTSVVPYAGETAQTLKTQPDGAGSDLSRALTDLAEPDPQQRTPLVGAVVISDGLVAPDGATDKHLRSVAKELGIPITTVSTGAPALKDVSVAQVRAGEFAFVENVTEIEASVVAHGLRGKATNVELRRDGELIRRQRLSLSADGIPTTLRFEVAPDRVGQFVYEIVVEPLEGEATTQNNRRAFVVKVLRDKVRVLHVAGRPDWDVRALRALLRRDPNVELLSYYILRGFDDISREDATAPLSLIPFPTDELFEEQLGSFDLVILHNFDAVQHQVGQYVDNMAQYVVDGGALVLIGGDLALSDRGYAPLANLMAVDTSVRSDLEHGRFRPEVTEAGLRHPITAWLRSAGASAGASGWSALPELDTFNPLPLHPRGEGIGASPLLVHPDRVGRDGQPMPLLAVAEPGRGRTMVLATGSTWRLGFAPDLPLIDGARPYDLLWLGAVRWLLRDDSSGRLQLETDMPRYQVGEPAQLQATTLSTSYAPEPQVEVQWELRALSGEPDAKSLKLGTWTTDGLGRARETLSDLPVGAYAAVARRELDAEEDPDAEASASADATRHEVRRVFIVEPPGRELARVDADPGTDRLRELAELTGGEALSAAAEDTLPEDVPVADLEQAVGGTGAVEGRQDRPLWNGWLALVLLVGSLGGEWVLRRRYGDP